MTQTNDRDNPERTGNASVSIDGDVSDSNIIIGDNNQITVEQTVPPKFLNRFSVTQWAGIGFTSVIILIATFLIITQLKPKTPPVMTGDFRIAVASFFENGDSGQDNLGFDLADSVRLRLEQDLQEINPELVITVWGPDKVGAIKGETAEDRANEAEAIANQIHADLIIYGVIDVSGNSWQVLPEFFISAENFHEGFEIVGQHELGKPFDLPGSANNSAWRFEFGKQMFTRSKTLSIMSVGLGYYALNQYDTAFETFQSGLINSEVGEEQGRKVLDIMAGFAAGKIAEDAINIDKDYEHAKVELDTGEQLLNQALEIDPDYSRPMIGIANINYMRALIPGLISGNSQDFDEALLNQCLEFLDKADAASNKPPLADIDAKIHFARGQCLLSIAYRNMGDATPAYHEFQEVIDAYGNGTNPRLREYAGESHARIAQLYKLFGNDEMAIQEYQIAIELLASTPHRQNLFIGELEELQNTTTPTP